MYANSEGMEWKPMITEHDRDAIPQLVDDDDVSTVKVENETIGQIADRWRSQQRYFGAAGPDESEESERMENLRNPSGQ